MAENTWYYIDSFATNLEYQVKLMYDDHKFFPSEKKTTRDGKEFETQDVWCYTAVMQNDVEGAHFYDTGKKAKDMNLHEGDYVKIKAKQGLHDQIQSGGFGKGDVLRIKKVEIDGNKTQILLLNEEKSRDIKESPTEYTPFTSESAPQPSTGISNGDAKDKAIQFQTCLKCASWLLAGRDTEGISSMVAGLARELYAELDEFVYGKEIEHVVDTEPLAANLLKIFGEGVDVVETLNQYIDTYNSTPDRNQVKFTGMDDITDDKLTGEFVEWTAEMHRLMEMAPK